MSNLDSSTPPPKFDGLDEISEVQPQGRSGEPKLSTDYLVRVADEADLRALGDEGNALAASAIEPAPSAEPWMLLPSIRHLVDGAQVRVVLVHALDGPLLGIFPLVVRSRSWGPGVAESWNHLYSLSAIPLVHRDEATGCISAFLDWFRQEMPAGMLLRLPEVRIEGAFFRSFLAAVHRERVDHVIESIWHRAFFRPATDSDAYESALSSGRHRRVRRLERRLGERGRLTYDELPPGTDPRSWLEAFMDLELAGWKGRQGTAFASQAEHREWLLEIGAEAAARQRLMMLALRLDEEPIALKLNFLAADGGHTFKIAYDERLEKFSPASCSNSRTSVACTREPALHGWTPWPRRGTRWPNACGPRGLRSRRCS